MPAIDRALLRRFADRVRAQYERGLGDRYFARGTTDDKGPALAALFGVAAAREAGVRVGVRLLWEMEEEIGSPSLEPVLRALARRVRPHSVVVSDAAWLDRRRPTSI